MKTRTWRLNNMGGGIDRRDGIITDNLDRFHDLVNVRTKNRRRVVRRCPCLEAGDFDTGSQGYVKHGGSHYVFAPKGTVPTLPATPANIEVVYFDYPSEALTGWTLLSVRSFKDSLVALIRHDYPAASAPTRDFLHVFDDKPNKPTYVEDPFCPTNWGSELPLHVTGTGKPGAYDPDFTPKMAVASGRLYISRPDGDDHGCAVGNARVWNTRTVEDLVADGEWYYFITTDTVGEQNFIISEEFDDLYATDAFSRWGGGWVLEYMQADGTWAEDTTENALANAHKRFSLTASTSRFGGPDEILLKLYWTAGGGTVLRFRLLTRPRVDLVVAPTTDGISSWGEPYVSSGGSVTRVNGGASDIEEFGSAVAVANSDLWGTGANPSNLGSLLLGYSGALSHQQQTSLLDGIDYAGSYTVIANYLNDNVSGYDRSRIYFSKRFDPKTVVGGTISNLTWTGSETTIDLSTGATPVGRYISIVTASGTPVVAYGVRHAFGAPTLTLRDKDGNAFNFTAVIANGDAFYAYGDPTDEPVTTDIEYGFISGEESEWFLNRKTMYLLDLAGADDAVVINTSAQDGAGGYITAQASRNDRLVIFYEGSTQIWSAKGTAEEIVFIDAGPIGTGAQLNPQPVDMVGTVVIGMVSGIRSVLLSGLNLDSIDDDNIGNAIDDLGYPEQLAAAYWPRMGAYITAVTIDGVFQFLVLDHEPSQKITAWCHWIVSGLETIDPGTMVVDNDRLYFRSAGTLYYFDLSATVFRDFNDVEGAAYESVMKSHLNEFGEPYAEKECVGAEVVTTGECFVSLRYNPNQPELETTRAYMPDASVGQRWVPLNAWGTALGVVIRSRDESGFTLSQYGLHFKSHRRI